ncbi:Probable peptide ABC transporter ATP-binding protein y4tR [Geodia barretti]|nr:Probable peptide ABC transporter ATP-binding protein y4tR [Geodia barretti]
MPGETLGLVGESGSGKTITCLSLLRLLPRGARIVGGKVLFNGQNTLDLSEKEMERLRGIRMGMILQNSMAALDPVFSIGTQIAEPLVVHSGLNWRAAIERSIDLLRMVKITAPHLRVRNYPHEMSGGMRQRASSAAALTLNPDLIVLDEPVSSLDVSIRSQVLNLLKDIQAERGISYILISHDLAPVEHMSHVIGVMYLGKLVELGDAELTCSEPQHPYTASLVAAATPPGTTPAWPIPIVGEVPSALETPSGCSFHPRCAYAMPICSQEVPSLAPTEDGRMVSCHLYPDEIKKIDKRAPIQVAQGISAASS